MTAEQPIIEGLHLATGAAASYISFQASLLFLLGLILFAIGAFIAFIVIHSRITGHRITGTIIGAIHRTRTKTKMRDGREIKKIKHDRALIVEYTRPNGILHREMSSDGMDKNTKYKTGDNIPLLVCLRDEYDDVYNAESKSGIIMSIIFLLIGGGLMLPVLKAFGMKKVFWLGLFVILIPVMYKIYNIFSGSGHDPQKRPKDKIFSDDEILPIEDIISNWRKLDREESKHTP